MRLFLVFGLVTIAAAQSALPAAPTFRTATHEVALDLVVTDAKERMVRDLVADEVKVFDNGQPVRLLSFHRVTGEAVAAPGDRAGSGSLTAPGSARALPVYNLVGLVFDRLTGRARLEAIATAQQFIEQDLGSHDYAGVYLLDLVFRELQPFTLNREKVLGAVNQIADMVGPSFLTHNAAASGGEQVTTVSTGAFGQPNGGSEGGAAVSQMQSDMDEIATRMDEEANSRLTLQPLLRMVQAMSQQPGRKAILFFSDQIAINTNTASIFHSLLRVANRAGVSFYVLDPGGLDTENENGNAVALQTQLAAQTQAIQRRTADTGFDPHLGEKIEAIGYSNRLGKLRDLAESTGGLLIANTNDLRGQLARVGDDIHSHYELTYPAAEGPEDGRYHAIKVVLARPHLVARTREGYYALPADLRPSQSYEPALLDLLGQSPRPDALVTDEALFVYPEREGDPTVALSLEMPLEGLQNQSKKLSTVQEHLDAMILVADEQGNIIRKFDHDFPIEGDSRLTQRALLFERQTRLAPGRYHVITLVREPASGRATVRSSALWVAAPAPGRSTLSSVAVIERTDALGAAGLSDAQNAATALDVKGIRIVPNVGEPLHRDGMRSLGLYFVVYPGRQPEGAVRVMFRRNGERVAQAEEALNAPPGDDRVPMLLSFPMTAFRPGAYEVEVRVGAAVQRTAFVLQ